MMTLDTRQIVDISPWVLLVITIASQVFTIIFERKMNETDNGDYPQKYAKYKRLHAITITTMFVFLVLSIVAGIVKATFD